MNTHRNVKKNCKPLLALLLSLFSLMPIVKADCPPCGPGYCLDTPAYRTALSVKKATASSKSFPSRLVSIYDNIDHCELCIRTAPDGFSIMRVELNGSISIDEWDKSNEKLDAKAVSEGKLAECYVILSRHAIAGCNQTEYNQRDDYNKTLDLNKKMSVNCE